MRNKPNINHYPGKKLFDIWNSCVIMHSINKKPLIERSRNRIASESCRLVRCSNMIVVNGLERAAWNHFFNESRRWRRSQPLTGDMYVCTWWVGLFYKPIRVAPQENSKLLSLAYASMRGMRAFFVYKFKESEDEVENQITFFYKERK